MPAPLHISYHIRRWRLRRHRSLASLAAEIGISKSSLSEYERHLVDLPTSRLCRLALALDVTLEQLVSYRDQL